MSKKPAGKLPEGWKWVQLGDICKVVNQRKPIKTDPPVMSISKYEGFVPSLEYFSKQVFSKDISKYKYVKRGQFAYSTIHLDEGSIARFTEGEGCLVSPMYTTFEVGDDVDGCFLLSALKSQSMVSRYLIEAQGSVNRRKSIPFSAFASIYIPLPPIDLQNWIADSIDSLDILIKNSKDLLESLNHAIKEFIEVFISNGKYPKDRLDNILEFKNGINYRQKENGKIVKVIGVGDFGKNRYLSDDYSPTEISIDRTPPDSYLIELGDFLFVRSNGNKNLVGRAVIVKSEIEDTFFSGFIIRGRIRKGVEIDLNYLSWVLNHPSFRSSLIPSGDYGQLSNLNQSVLGEALISLPSIERQRLLSDTLTEFENQISALRKEIETIEFIKKTLLHQILTGSLQPTSSWQAVLCKSAQAASP
ncbi:restriction endonuclease subunit S [Deinococcus soli (ex Cha et al. 2016)]|uniref:Type I restriction enzyme S subunit n=2 Tax=Deinococcus soli (ex Cha et al. 2016) TaxID=1309411 RepID=A0ACC6KP64_9DEIO|nr:restriction endonuclease subunit S [Deinococcus soli (ex Cha et al. 2016)]MDR6221297.1 type I restriction enzyme S subunit [Deinococcus soli (ex Cha et al. 2016)]MDR6331212.1 type I restriction enzyme S subunit [Deinococcus soli (ex Cha et al. 2016)]MDR6754429.1 type I restriction enzyme S subunit [Deinococcus soli (ex Cha et al. 2016)]